MRTMMLPTTARTRKPGTTTTSAPAAPVTVSAPTTASTKVAFAWPTRTDTVITRIRPTLAPLATYVIDQGGKGDFTTFTDAMAAAATKQSIAMAIKNSTVTDPTMRVDFMVTPGTYAEMIPSITPHTAFFAQDPTHKPVLTGSAHDKPSGGVIAPTNSLYWESIDITNVPNDYSGPGIPIVGWDPKYPTHQSCYGTIIYADTTLWNNAPNSGGGSLCAGSDGESYGYTLFHGVNFKGGGANMHGAQNNTGPETIVYSACTGATATSPLGWSDLGAGTSDQIWLVNATSAYEFDLSGGVNVGVHVEAGVTTKVVSKISGGTPFDVGTTQAWPIPTGAMSAWEKTTYGLSA